MSSAYINVSLDVMDKGRSFVNNINKVGPKTEPCGTPHLATVILPCSFKVSGRTASNFSDLCSDLKTVYVKVKNE